MKIRRATMKDAMDIFDWRNDPTTRQMSLGQEEVQLDDHVTWLSRALSNDDICIFIAQDDDVKTAVIRFDRKLDTLLVSINLNPKFRNKGLATSILNNSIEEISAVWQFNEIEAEIRPENQASIRLFEKCGFRKKATNNNILMYSKS